MAAIIEKLRAEYKIISAALYPKIDLIASAGQASWSEYDNRYDQGDYQLSLPVAYEIDVWKRLGAERKAVYFESEAAMYDRQALLVTLTAELVERYFIGLYLREQITLLDIDIDLIGQKCKLLRKCYESGTVSKNEVYEAEQTVRRLTAEKIRLTGELAIFENSLNVLAGEEPREGWLKGVFIVPHWLKDVPAGLSSDHVKQRPDLCAIRFRMDSSEQRLKSARAAFFPAFYLTSQVNTISDELNGVLRDENIGWGIFAQTRVPVYDGGRKDAVYQSELSVQKGLAEEYKQLLLNAFAEIARAIKSGKLQLEIINNFREGLSLAKNDADIVNKQYELGYKDLLELTSKKQALIESEMELRRAQLQFVAYRIQLFRALAGGWWE
jgi:outer membrane protein TolC